MGRSERPMNATARNSAHVFGLRRSHPKKVALPIHWFVDDELIS